jgi:uncharacterized flavoprotein (TIGR03862 family)
MAQESFIKIAIIGSGPAGLMAADTLATQGYAVTLFDKRPAPGWKLFLAGSSGLNISNELPYAEFVRHYTGPVELWGKIHRHFTTAEWLGFIEKELEVGTFLGTSGRYFVETMHAATLIRNWRRRLTQLGTVFFFHHEWSNLIRLREKKVWQVQFTGQKPQEFHYVCLALGGASHEPEESPLRWPAFFKKHGLPWQEFSPSNTGYEVSWPAPFLKEAEGLPLKNVTLTTARGSRRGDLVVTAYGLEGTPVYSLGVTGVAALDLKPDLTAEAIVQKLLRPKENLALLRRAKKYLQLDAAAQALLFHLAPDLSRLDLHEFAALLKQFPLQLGAPRPLTESISSSGGVKFEALDDNLMLKDWPGVYLAGEMIDWDAPTGGFLIQGCAAMGRWIGSAIARELQGSSG